MQTWQLSAFLILSGILAYISRRSLPLPRSHGFSRFFAWELILALLLLNIQRWFADWLHWHQVISWILLSGSLAPLLFGIRALGSRGRPDARLRAQPELLAFEQTTQLVTAGAYGYIRHPLYSSLLLLAWGVFFKQPSWVGLFLACCVSALLVATARRDEAECIETFGPSYRQYMQHTRMFIPYIF